MLREDRESTQRVTMIKLVNSITGVDMWVAENRVAEYLAEGHKLAVEVPPAPPLPKKPAGKKTATKKGTAKK